MTIAKDNPKKQPAGGRKSKRTDEVKSKLIIALQNGNTKRAACAFAGISESEFYEWQAECTEFAETITRAENVAEFGFINVVQECAQNGDWKAAAWWLERRRKSDYSQRVEQTGADGGPMKMHVTADQLTDDELARIAVRD